MWMLEARYRDVFSVSLPDGVQGRYKRHGERRRECGHKKGL